MGIKKRLRRGESPTFNYTYLLRYCWESHLSGFFRQLSESKLDQKSQGQ